MPTLIHFGMVNSNSPQQNAGVLIGEINTGGWDANMKINQGHGALFGFFNLVYLQYNVNIDNFEMLDGVINDQDFKPMVGGNL
ncbi:hypothetical protein [Alicyclobacillus mengziensis]|uniref:Uncharacterized protein n=1 Tax=Alicyclobacillus mengziensis TaxID=2931921 RepID=A0A9X7Z8J0_9BACL|nr:hypothetical protein [Alicyclobacillus mengziensis]QSO48271.1 hypothetical protein JZ786_04555 [Alicyclobacillus mengziensis]